MDISIYYTQVACVENILFIIRFTDIETFYITIWDMTLQNIHAKYIKLYDRIFISIDCTGVVYA